MGKKKTSFSRYTKMMNNYEIEEVRDEYSPYSMYLTQYDLFLEDRDATLLVGLRREEKMNYEFGVIIDEYGELVEPKFVIVVYIFEDQRMTEETKKFLKKWGFEKK